MDYARRNGLYLPLNKQVVPASDLGLEQAQLPELRLFEDMPVVLAINAVQTPTGPRVLQTDSSGSLQPAAAPTFTLLRSATEGAGNTGLITPTGNSRVEYHIEILALNGAPTNVSYRFDATYDSGTTYQLSGNQAQPVPGIVRLAAGIGSTLSANGGSLGANFAWTGALPPGWRVLWFFVGGTAPTVQHRIWEVRQ